MKLRITVLGSGTSLGVPMIACRCKVCTSGNPKDNRLRPSVLIQVGNKSLVIDIGPDFRMQMLNNDIRHIDGVLMTHSHRDHTAGLDDLRAFNWINKKAVSIYAEPPVIEVLKHDFWYAFTETRFEGLPEIEFQAIDDKPFSLDGIDIVPVRLMHYKLPVLGYRVGDFSYLTDTNFVPREEYSKLKGTKVLIVDGLRNEEHISHFNIKQALELIKEIGPEKAYITHISHQLGLHDEVNAILPPNVELAYDGLVIDIN